jgi:hypothetical protein
MKNYIIIVSIFIISMANSWTQNCINSLSGQAGSYQFQNGANCNIRLCVTVNGTPRPKQIQFELTTPSVTAIAMCQDGAIHALPFDCGNGGASQFADGTYCHTFTVAGTCPATVNGVVRGYTNGAGGAGGECNTVTYSNVPLPIRLISFGTTSYSEGIKLSWQTSEETNSSMFEVQRSKNAIDFDVLSQIKAAGNSSEIRNYVYTDANPKAGYNYYRLKSVDTDGAFQFSSIIAAKYLPNGDIVVAPNPSNSQIIKVLTKGFKIEEAQLFSLEGKSNLINLRFADSNNLLEVMPQKPLATGVYFLIINTELGILKQKVIIE